MGVGLGSGLGFRGRVELAAHRGTEERAVPRRPPQPVLHLGRARHVAAGLALDDKHELVVEVGRLVRVRVRIRVRV